jgi:hypothetical protein
VSINEAESAIRPGKGTAMSNSDNAALYEPWGALWNGDLSITDTIIAEDFTGHLAPLSGTGPDQFHGRQPLNDWISGIHALLPDLSFVLDVGPIADEQYLVVRWKARGTYRGGFPGASSALPGGNSSTAVRLPRSRRGSDQPQSPTAARTAP